jgi:hypothetical protein
VAVIAAPGSTPAALAVKAANGDDPNRFRRHRCRDECARGAESGRRFRAENVGPQREQSRTGGFCSQGFRRNSATAIVNVRFSILGLSGDVRLEAPK